MSLAVMCHDFSYHPIDLHGQLPRRRDDEHASAIPGLELGPMKQLHAWYEEGQRFARPCSCTVRSLAGKIWAVPLYTAKGSKWQKIAFLTSPVAHSSIGGQTGAF